MEGYGKRDFLHPTVKLIDDKKEEILRAWLEKGQTERATGATWERAEEIWRDFLSAVISEVGAWAGDKFKSVGADVLAKCFLDLERTAGKVLEGLTNPTDLHRSFGEGLIALLSAHAVVTQNLTKEYRKAIDESAIVSVSDTHGVITYANDKFCEISGYERDELIGKPHNIVRHPDMPKSEFEQMWKTIKNKEVWRGVIKNRRKNGGHYWVRTTITPILCVNGEIREFISIRWKIPDSTAFAETGMT